MELFAYVATKTNGIYFSDDFTITGAQPTWATKNGGLPSTDVRLFHVDPLLPNQYQYLQLLGTRTIYRRNTGVSENWAAILTEAQALTLVGGSGGTDELNWFCPNLGTEGELYANFNWTHAGYTDRYILKSTDRGNNWSVLKSFGWGNWSNRGLWVYGDTIWLSWASGATSVVSYSANDGSTFKDDSGNQASISNSDFCPKASPLAPAKAYLMYAPSVDMAVWEDLGGAYLTVTKIQDALNLDDGGSLLATMIYDPITAATQWMLVNGKIYKTTDSWTTVNSPSNLTGAVINLIFAVPGSVAIALGDSAIEADHAIFTLADDTDTSLEGRAGTNAGTAPYTDSVPETCGGVAYNGIAVIPSTYRKAQTPKVYYLPQLPYPQLYL